MKVVILPSAREDLADGFEFYERQGEGLGSLGSYFLESLFSEIESWAAMTEDRTHSWATPTACTPLTSKLRTIGDRRLTTIRWKQL